MPGPDNPIGSAGAAGYADRWSPFGDPDANDPDPKVRRRFFGKYRGSVVENVDPLFQARLLVSVPDVFGLLSSSWAMPCVPMTGPLAGTFVRPPIGADVWVEFEQGDPQMPIWVGGFWATGEVPPTAEVASVTVPPTNAIITLETPTASISISDIPIGPLGNICLRYGPETLITLDPTGIRMVAPTVTIVAPEISMTGNVTIEGATEVVGDVTLIGATEVVGDVTLIGATEAVGDVAIAGSTTALGALNAAGAVNIVGNVLIGGLLNGLPPL
jgi:phage baseplate assembly protein gpV